MKDTIQTLIEEVQANKIIAIATLGQSAIASGNPKGFLQAVTNSSIEAALNFPIPKSEGMTDIDVKNSREIIAEKIKNILGGLVFSK
ncbi:MAG: hypothetical protein ACKVIX_08200 [Sphingomonadales bacterium]|jgi:hypothetical protein